MPHPNSLLKLFYIILQSILCDKRKIDLEHRKYPNLCAFLWYTRLNNINIGRKVTVLIIDSQRIFTKENHG
jgi:hypothetical protein